LDALVVELDDIVAASDTIRTAAARARKEARALHGTD
jgi:hypothetical protein